jgi:four helix bundle protein
VIGGKHEHSRIAAARGLAQVKGFRIEDLPRDFASITSRRKMGIEPAFRRSSVSISANIAEGYGRYYYQDNVRFCYNARGSLEETLSHIVFCNEIGYIPAALFQELAREGEEITRMVNGYIAYLKKSKQGANEPGANHIVHKL